MPSYPTLSTVSATPQVLTGDDGLGLGVDDSLQGFRKYNNHVHLPAISNDFLVYDVAIGDEVFIYNEEGNNIFEVVDAPVIDYISNTQIRINVSSPVAMQDVSMYIKAPMEDTQNSILVPGVDVVVGSNIIGFNQERDRGGFLSLTQFDILRKKSTHFNFTFTQGSSYNTTPLYSWIHEKNWFQGAYFYMPVGGATVYFRITKAIGGEVIESDPIVITAATIASSSYITDVVANTEQYAGLLNSPLVSGDLMELVVSSITFSEGVTQVMLVGVLDLLRVL